MACFHPLKAFKLGGRVHFGTRTTPLAETLSLPCGQCIGCRLERSRQWATRIMFEAQLHEENCFITLTYNDQHLPNPPSLKYEDYQLFMKRLRKTLGHKVRFFACGEYGERTFRPHYHAVIFGHDFPDKVLFSRSDSGHDIFVSPSLQKCWGLGHTTVQDLEFNSAAYVAKYSLKKVTGEAAEAHYQWIDQETGECTQLQPEFARMSLKPGIGGKWFDLYNADVYAGHDYVIVNGHKCRPPRYFDRLLERRNPERFEEIKEERATRAKRLEGDNTPERLAVKEAVKEAQVERSIPRKTL
ncbi:VP4 [Gokushovirus WZ-2015a]|nr:VP4 [Gokushovirus WZ-2015a]